MPPCPLTGHPARRRVHGLATGPLKTLWRVAGAGDLSRLFSGIERLELYESEAGLYFFHPMIVGDSDFYQRFYAQFRAHAHINRHLMERVEFKHAAKLVQPGMAVLDVGCGMGAFGAHIGHARYTGLDPFAPHTAPACVLREALDAHAERNPATYDVVTAFQVIEHTHEPRRFAGLLVRLLRPGGLLILCAPMHPSPLTQIPNFLINVPPHHVTWWSEAAFAALADILGVEPVEISQLPMSPHAAVITWMRRFSFVCSEAPPNERYFAHRWSWHLNLVTSYCLARVIDRFAKPASRGEPIDVFMAARKPK